MLQQVDLAAAVNARLAGQHVEGAGCQLLRARQLGKLLSHENDILFGAVLQPVERHGALSCHVGALLYVPWNRYAVKSLNRPSLTGDGRVAPLTRAKLRKS